MTARRELHWVLAPYPDWTDRADDPPNRLFAWIAADPVGLYVVRSGPAHWGRAWIAWRRHPDRDELIGDRFRSARSARKACGEHWRAPCE